MPDQLDHIDLTGWLAFACFALILLVATISLIRWLLLISSRRHLIERAEQRGFRWGYRQGVRDGQRTVPTQQFEPVPRDPNLPTDHTHTATRQA